MIVRGMKCMHFDKKTLKNTIIYIFLGVAGCILLYWLLHETERVKTVFDKIGDVFRPFVIGAGIAFVINVPMRSIENKLTKIKNDMLRRTVALILTTIAVLLVLALVFYLLIPQIIDTARTFGERLPVFFGNVQKVIVDFLNDNPQLMQWVYENTDFKNMDFGSLIEKFLDMAGNSVSTILSGAFTAIGGIAGLLVNLVIGIVFSFYCLYNKEVLARQGRKLLYAYFPESWADNTVRILRLTNSTFSNFFTGQCLEVCILGVMFAISMAIFRMPYIPLVSVIIAVTALIPVVGAFVGCIVSTRLMQRFVIKAFPAYLEENAVEGSPKFAVQKEEVVEARAGVESYGIWGIKSQDL